MARAEIVALALFVGGLVWLAAYVAPRIAAALALLSYYFTGSFT